MELHCYAMAEQGEAARAWQGNGMVLIARMSSGIGMNGKAKPRNCGAEQSTDAYAWQRQSKEMNRSAAARPRTVNRGEGIEQPIQATLLARRSVARVAWHWHGDVMRGDGKARTSNAMRSKGNELKRAEENGNGEASKSMAEQRQRKAKLCEAKARRGNDVLRTVFSKIKN